MKDKKYDDAAKSLRRSVELAPKHRPSYDALIEIFAETKQNYESRMLLNDMVKIFGPKKEFAHKLCKLYAVDSYLKEAQDACKMAIRLDPKFPDSHVYLAQTYADMENTQTAERILKTAARQFTKSEFVQYAAGEYYLNTKNYSAAVRYLEQAVKVNPETLRAQLTLAMALFESREHQRAMTHFDKACRMDKTNESLLAFKSAASRLRKLNLNSLADEYDRKTATCQK
jgi:tetratricopeptide (TPR) repeat protein